MAGPTDLLVITGSMGAGKTAVLAEASDLLARAAVPHAAIDLDMFGVYHSPMPLPSDAPVINLAAIWGTYAAGGITRLLLAEALESAAALGQLRARLMPERVKVCRLRAPIPVMQERVRARESGIMQDHYVARVEVLEGLLDAAALEDFTVRNGGRSVTDVAHEMLTRASWL